MSERFYVLPHELYGMGGEPAGVDPDSGDFVTVVLAAEFVGVADQMRDARIVYADLMAERRDLGDPKIIGRCLDALGAALGVPDG